MKLLSHKQSLLCSDLAIRLVPGIYKALKGAASLRKLVAFQLGWYKRKAASEHDNSDTLSCDSSAMSPIAEGSPAANRSHLIPLVGLAGDSAGDVDGALQYMSSYASYAHVNQVNSSTGDS